MRIRRIRTADAIEPKYRAMVLLAGFRGMRFGECAGLVRRRVDLLHKKLDIRQQAVERPTAP